MLPKIGRKQWIGYLLIFCGAMCYALDGILLSSVNQRYSLSAEFMIFFRLLVGTLFLLVVLSLTQPVQLKIRKHDLTSLLIMGVLFEAIGGFAYTTAIFRIGVSISTVLAHTAPIWVTLYVVLKRQEKLALSKIVTFAASYLGMLLITQAYAYDSIKLDSLGIAMGLICGLVVAAFFLISQRAGRLYSPWTITFYNLAGGTLFMAFFQHPNQWDEFLFHPQIVIWLLLLALGPGFIAVICWIAAVRFTQASVGSQVGGALEPLLASIAAFFILGERLTIIQMIGAGLIISSLVVLGVSDLIRTRVKLPTGEEILQERFETAIDQSAKSLLVNVGDYKNG